MKEKLILIKNELRKRKDEIFNKVMNNDLECAERTLEEHQDDLEEIVDKLEDLIDKLQN